jgi:hypothetical protein
MHKITIDNRQNIVLLLFQGRRMGSKNFHKKEEQPCQSEKDNREHQQEQYRICVIPPDLAMQTKVFHIMRTVSSEVLRLLRADRQARTMVHV